MKLWVASQVCQNATHGMGSFIIGCLHTSSHVWYDVIMEPKCSVSICNIIQVSPGKKVVYQTYSTPKQTFVESTYLRERVPQEPPPAYLRERVPQERPPAYLRERVPQERPPPREEPTPKPTVVVRLHNSLVPRLTPAFGRLQYGKTIKSWGKSWDEATCIIQAWISAPI